MIFVLNNISQKKVSPHLHATQMFAGSHPMSIYTFVWFEERDTIDIQPCWSLELPHNVLNSCSTLLKDQTKNNKYSKNLSVCEVINWRILTLTAPCKGGKNERGGG